MAGSGSGAPPDRAAPHVPRARSTPPLISTSGGQQTSRKRECSEKPPIVGASKPESVTTLVIFRPVETSLAQLSETRPRQIDPGPRGRSTSCTCTSDADKIHGVGGSDRILGRGGKDLLYGGPVADQISAGAKADMIWGGKDADTITAGARAPTPCTQARGTTASSPRTAAPGMRRLLVEPASERLGSTDTS